MSQTSAKQLIKNAAQEGLLTAGATKALNVVDIGAEIEAALGVDVDNVQSSEVILVSQMPDDSDSIRFAGNTQNVRDGHNEVIEALRETKQADSILAHTRYLNGFILFPYQPIAQAVLMDQNNYDPNMGTPLYDQTVVLLGTVLAKAQAFADNGVPVRTITLIISDGADQGSHRSTPKDCAKIVADMLKSENHIVASMGIDDGSTDFRRVFGEMGIPDEWIITPKNDKHSIRQAFRMFSQSAVRASQSAANFSKLQVGGFGS
ncbi:MAG: hypothetical protein WCT08_06070 [Patescibacteria group bacterium]|jgi:hypothetical protein